VVAAQVQQIRSPSELYPPKLDQVDGQQRRDRPEGEGPDNAVAQGAALLLLRQAENEDRQHHGVVGAQKPFERHE
jgi:hypothetical protein